MRQIKGSLFLWVPIIVIGLYYLFSTAYVGITTPALKWTFVQGVCILVSISILIFYIGIEIVHAIEYIKEKEDYFPLILTTIAAGVMIITKWMNDNLTINLDKNK